MDSAMLESWLRRLREVVRAVQITSPVETTDPTKENP